MVRKQIQKELKRGLKRAQRASKHLTIRVDRVISDLASVVRRDFSRMDVMVTSVFVMGVLYVHSQGVITNQFIPWLTNNGHTGWATWLAKYEVQIACVLSTFVSISSMPGNTKILGVIFAIGAAWIAPKPHVWAFAAAGTAVHFFMRVKDPSTRVALVALILGLYFTGFISLPDLGVKNDKVNGTDHHLNKTVDDSHKRHKVVETVPVQPASGTVPPPKKT